MLITTISDLRQCYLFFLGREAEASAPLVERTSSSAPEVAVSFLRSPEFQQNVVDSVLQNGWLMVPLLKRAPPVSRLEWAARYLPLSSEGKTALRASRTWPEAYRTVFTDAIFKRDVFQAFGFELPPEFALGLDDLAGRELMTLGGVLIGPSNVTVSLLLSEDAPVDYTPKVKARFSNSVVANDDTELVIVSSVEGSTYKVSIHYVGAARTVDVDVYLDEELLIGQVTLNGGPSSLKKLPSAVGRVDVCGPLFISGWMTPLSGAGGSEYEVLVDGEVCGRGRVPDPKPGEVPRFLFPIPKYLKDGRLHDVLVRRQLDGANLPSGEGTFVIGVPALEMEWSLDGLIIRIQEDYASSVTPEQALIILTCGMEKIGEYPIGRAVGSNKRVIAGVMVPAVSLLPFIGRRITATLPALFAETSATVPMAEVAGILAGSIDGLDQNASTIFGWCAFRGRQDHSLHIDASVDGELIGTFPADIARQDLAGLHGKGFHGFSIEIPEKYRDGRTHALTLCDHSTGVQVPKSPFPFVLTPGQTIRPTIAVGVADSLSVAPSVNSASKVEGAEERITIVILTRNGEPVLEECLASIWKFTPTSLIKIVIVDHQSSDGTAAMVQRWKSKLSIRYEFVEGNNSFSFANNWAVKEFADTEYVLLLNNDIIMIEDAISRMMHYLDDNRDVGLVGCKLLEARDRGDLTKAAVHHLGIQLELSPGATVEPLEANRSRYIADQSAELETYSVTGACVLMRRTEYMEIGGLDESYFYGGEDVELGEAIWADLNKKVVCLNNVTALHHRGWLRLSARGADGLSRIHQNGRVMRRRIGYQMRKRYARGLVDSERRWAASRARIGFVVVEYGPVARTGEYFTAVELGGALSSRHGVSVEFIEPSLDWYDVSGLTHVINMLHEYRIADIRGARPDICKIAWMRNNFEAWVQQGELQQYHMVWCSSKAFCQELADSHGIVAQYVPIATNMQLMRSGARVEHYASDVAFNGSHSGVARSFVEALATPEWHDRFAVYGHGWEDMPSVKPVWRGFLPYDEMKNLYANVRIVIDHAHSSAAEWGGTNSRVFDAIAAGCLPLTNSARSSEADFQGLLPVWQTDTELRDLVAHYLENEEERRALVSELGAIVEREHQYTQRADRVAGLLLEASDQVRTVAIKIGAPRRSEAASWGDTHLAEVLAQALRGRGLYVRVQCIEEWSSRTELFDAALVLRGLSRYEARDDELSVSWVISHPDDVSVAEVAQYDAVAFGSQTLASRYGEKAALSTVVRQFSAFGNTQDHIPKLDAASAAMLERISPEDIIFVGNTRGQVRDFIVEISRSLPIKIIGKGWDQYVPVDMVLGTYIDNAALPLVYRKAFAVLNDHWPDMLEANILSNRVADVLMSGGLVISDWNDEGASLVSESLFFKSAGEAVQALRRFQADPASRARAIAEARQNVLHSFNAEAGAERIHQLLQTAHQNRMNGSRRTRGHAKVGGSKDPRSRVE